MIRQHIAQPGSTRFTPQCGGFRYSTRRPAHEVLAEHSTGHRLNSSARLTLQMAFHTRGRPAGSADQRPENDRLRDRRYYDISPAARHARTG